jgi:hypothetical protein
MIGRNSRWILLLQEFDFKVVLKLGRIHFLPDHLSRINHGELVIGIDDQLLDVHLFNVGLDWYGPIIEYLKKDILTMMYLKRKEVE